MDGWLPNRSGTGTPASRPAMFLARLAMLVALSVGLVAFGLINVAALVSGGVARAMHARKE